MRRVRADAPTSFMLVDYDNLPVRSRRSLCLFTYTVFPPDEWGSAEGTGTAADCYLPKKMSEKMSEKKPRPLHNPPARNGMPCWKRWTRGIQPGEWNRGSTNDDRSTLAPVEGRTKRTPGCIIAPCYHRRLPARAYCIPCRD